MQEYTPEEAAKKLLTLPTEVQQMVYSPELATTLKNIGDKHGLHIDQVGVLEKITNDTLLGYQQPNEIPPRIKETFNLKTEAAEAIAQDINTFVFLKLREHMKEDAEQGTQPTPSPATQTTIPLAAIPSTPPAPAPELHPADMSLAHTTIMKAPASPLPSTTPSTPAPTAPVAQTVAPIDPSAPKPYAKDPYRESVEP